MKRHLTEQELIEYRFRLGTDAEVDRAGEHLAECEHCRAELEKLERKFAALDLLREEVTVSEDLVSKIIEQAAEPRRVKAAASKKLPVWAGAAAAVLVVGVLLMVANRPEKADRGERFVKGPEKGITIRPQEFVEPGSAIKWGSAGSGHKYGMGGTTGLAEGIPEKPPFAPASAIELTTLPRRDNVQLTIYNSADLTLVRETRNLTLKKGWNWLQFMWANTLIDPTSLSLEPKEKGEKIDIQQLVFPARLRELGRWLIRSEVSGQVPFEITYFTSGLSWRAFYMGTLASDEKTMQMKGYVRVTNASGEEYEKAQTRLIVGQVHLLDQIAQLAKRQHAYGSPVPVHGKVADWFAETKEAAKVLTGNISGFATLDYAGTLGALKPKEIKKEGLSEYFLYTIEGTETIPDKWGKRLLSFEAEDIEVESLYKYDDERWGNQTIRFVKFANDEEHNLGDTPIPDGQVRIYSQTDEDGLLSYVGGTGVKYIPVNEEVELNLGGARLVKVEPKLMDFKTKNYRFDGRHNISGWDEVRTFKIEVRNTRALAVKVEIKRNFPTQYWDLKQTTPLGEYEKEDLDTVKFTLELEPRSKKEFGYVLTTYHGVRTEGR